MRSLHKEEEKVELGICRFVVTPCHIDQRGRTERDYIARVQLAKSIRQVLNASNESTRHTIQVLYDRLSIRLYRDLAMVAPQARVATMYRGGDRGATSVVAAYRVAPLVEREQGSVGKVVGDQLQVSTYRLPLGSKLSIACVEML